MRTRLDRMRCNRRKRHRRPLLVAAVLLSMFCLAGCASPPASNKGIGDDDPAVRIRAIKRAGDDRDFSVATQLVEQLSSDDPAVRFYAIAALRRMAGSDLGYHYYDDGPGRREATGRWRNWLKSSQATGSATTRPAVVEGQ